MINNKRGLSEIVTTVIIVLLVLVAVGILWAVVGNMIEENVESIDLNAKCLNVNLEVTRLIESSAGDYDLTVSRSGSGEGDVGLKVIFLNTETNTNSDVLDSNTLFGPLDINTMSFTGTGVNDANRVKITPYFVGESNEQLFCPNSLEFDF